MRYPGGKKRLGKRIAGQLLKLYDGEPYVEPFVGVASVMAAMQGVPCRFGYDISESMILLLEAVRDGWIPPATITEEEYYETKARTDPSPMRAFVGFGSSWGGKWWGGPARGENITIGDFTRRASESLVRIAPFLAGVRFKCLDYLDVDPSGCFVYCDPPYDGKNYFDAPNFDIDQFWSVVGGWAKDTTVVVSSYSAPVGWRSIWSIEHAGNMRTDRERDVENLWIRDT